MVQKVASAAHRESFVALALRPVELSLAEALGQKAHTQAGMDSWLNKNGVRSEMFGKGLCRNDPRTQVFFKVLEVIENLSKRSSYPLKWVILENACALTYSRSHIAGALTYSRSPGALGAISGHPFVHRLRANVNIL